LSLERGLSPGGDRSAALQEAIGEVDRLQRTVATLLALARATPTSAEFCDVATVCHEVAARWNGILAAHGRPMRVDVQPGLPPVACSEAALAEVLQILVDNAVTHGRGEVTIVGRHVGPGVVVHVEDEGSGIVTDGDDLFQRGAAAGGGHGIGLALARSLAEAYGGRVRLRSANPHTVFTVALRTHEADEDLSR
jgi:signal transduction histidine kinase